ncbi:phage holin family protein [Desulforamulus ruminis]|uniref:Toxin secretion/phage lysis holin n=1 Tax=Desulforamulus ruminis (strain ATCC 23193 / DSM 2154 / NCIMB 8452 / DL) TaxID=696281 RepID=F6DPG0_DESRL|nr:phage holin family protein [Desulforamulus ruminis]AEG58633.1 toxin secretion/phage lysis holin [Desulforamulus ruminis DSM 2154]
MDNKVISFIIATSGTLGTYFLGGFDLIIRTLIILVLFDYITGVASSVINNSLNSEIGFRGIMRKVGIFFVVALAHLLDMTTGLEDPLLRTMTIWFYITNEGLSILENLGKMGVPLPPLLVRTLEKLKIQTDDQSKQKRS